MPRLLANFSRRLALGATWLASSLAFSAGCGGTAQRAPDAGKGGGSAGAAVAGATSMDPGGMGGTLGSAGGKPPASAGSLSAPAACSVGILPAALEGCRAPNEPGCASCYVERSDGSCEVYSGSARRDDYFVYNMVTVPDDGCKNVPRCASCFRETEDALCQETMNLDCDCREPPGVDPCFFPEGCGCFCQQHGQNRKACPQAD